jgi:hypothetical protein
MLHRLGVGDIRLSLLDVRAAGDGAAQSSERFRIGLGLLCRCHGRLD